MSAILGADGQPAEAPAPNGAPPSDLPPEDKPAEPGPAIAFSIDPKGVLVLSIPLAQTNPIFTRGMIDVVRTEAIQWYARQNAAQRQMQAEVQALAQKSRTRQFFDKVMRRG